MKRNDVLTTLLKLPDVCYALLPSTGEIIGIRRGEMGYVPLTLSHPPYDRRSNQERIDDLNLGVATRVHVEAMLNGSMFGWETPAADPDNYALDGTGKVRWIGGQA